MKFFSGKRIWLWALPLLAVSLGLWRVQEARTWLPKDVGLFERARGGEFFRVPVVWRNNGVWLLRCDTSTPGLVSGRWKHLENWDRSGVPVYLAATDRNEVAAVSADGARVLRNKHESIGLWEGGKLIRSVREKSVPNRTNLQKPERISVLALAPDSARWAASSSLSGLSEVKDVDKGFSEYGAVLWDASSGRQIARYNAQGGSFAALAFHPTRNDWPE